MKRILPIMLLVVFISKCKVCIRPDVDRIKHESDSMMQKKLIIRALISAVSFIFILISICFVYTIIGVITYFIAIATYMVSSGTIYDLDTLFDMKYKNFTVRLLPKSRKNNL